MAYLEEPIEIFYNFLRSYLSEVTRTDPALANRQTADSQVFEGDAIEDEFTLTNSPVSVVSVIVDGTTLIPYQQYGIDLDNKKIKIYPTPADEASITVNYYKGNTWIFPNDAKDDLIRQVYPRVVITPINTNGSTKEQGDMETNDNVTFQCDILAFKDYFCEVPINSNEDKAGPDVTTYLARQLIEAFKTNFNAQLQHVFRVPNGGSFLLGNSPVPFEPNKNIYRRVVELQIVARNNTIIT